MAAITWFDGVEQPATLDGWWDGATEQVVVVEGWWDGSSVQPLAEAQ